MVHKLVVRRTQERVARAPAKPRHIDQGLRVLDPKADRERLGLNVHPAAVQHLERIAGAVPHGQHHMIRRDPRTTGQHHAANPPRAVSAGFNIQVRHTALKPVLTAQGLDRRPHVLNHLDEPKRADVRVRIN